MAEAVYISHGGGPLPLLDHSGHRDLVTNLRRLAGIVSKPTRVLVVSAHWEAPEPTVTGGAHPELIYDYFGFPEESYRIRYDAPGDPSFAEVVARSLEQAGFRAHVDGQRGFDHGLFVPLKLMYPEASIPCLQLSLSSDLDPAKHIAVGEALRRIEASDFLLVGSGFSFHNMEALRGPVTDASQAANEAFQSWLHKTIASSELNEDSRRQRLVHWADAPGARHCHPREEHLLPLHVCCGLSGRACTKAYRFDVLERSSSAFAWLGS